MVRRITVLIVTTALISCDSQEWKWNEDCEASKVLYQKARDAMCVPWGERREAALAELVAATQDPRFIEAVTTDAISDYVGDIGPDDCIAAGFPDPGEKLPDQERTRFRELLANVPPPPSLSSEEMQSTRDNVASARRCDLSDTDTN